jgi:two-component sensor histidine kinase/CheY-like chemotaxis protein
VSGGIVSGAVCISAPRSGVRVMPLSGSTILYIDDDEVLCRLIKRHLERLGCTVTCVFSGADGLHHARQQPFDLVVLDHVMPGMGGMETLEELMGLPSPPAVIYVTASDDSGIAVAALKAGVVDYVVKSASGDFFELLTNTLHQALDAARLRKQKERAEHELRETNRQLAALLQEVNHRVANSLQMVSTLVNLQGRRAQGAEAKTMLQDVQSRIQAIARIHQQLYAGASIHDVNIADYIEGIARDLSRTYSTPTVRRDITVEAEPARITAATAVTLGILINELVTNACKYAYAREEPGEVRIVFNDEGEGGYRLRVEDDGVGLGKSVSPSGTGLGSQIIRSMVLFLGAQLRQFSPGRGHCVEVHWPAGSPPHPRAAVR